MQRDLRGGRRYHDGHLGDSSIELSRGLFSILVSINRVTGYGPATPGSRLDCGERGDSRSVGAGGLGCRGKERGLGREGANNGRGFALSRCFPVHVPLCPSVSFSCSSGCFFGLFNPRLARSAPIVESFPGKPFHENCAAPEHH